MTGREIDVDVLIVGGGPVGLLGGILAAEHGLSALVVERRSGTQTAPAAHVVNARTYEICRQAGLDMERIFAAGKDPVDAGHVNFVTNLAGDLVGRLPFERQGDDCLEYTPTPLRNLSQHRFEPILADELGARPGVELRYEHEWVSSVEEGNRVVSTVRDRERDEDLRVVSGYVIGCDGAGSRVRKHLGIELHGPPLLQCYLMIHFSAALRDLVADRPGVLHFVLDPQIGGAFIAHDLDSDWVLMHSIDADTESVEDYPDERCLEVIRAAAGADIDAEVLGRSTWRMTAQVADGMGGGRIFLAGDAAHRFPPTGGLGLNSGAADIHGLMWRIAAIEHGWGRPALLDSYAEERLPVARINSEQSLTNAIKMVYLSQALGTDVDPTTERLQASLNDPSKTQAIADAVEMQAEHFDMIGLQLGYVYGEDDGAENPRVFEPSARPGARLPHAWLAEVRGRSTLDLVNISRPTLISFGDHETWTAAAGAWDFLDHVRVGVDTPELDGWRDVCEVEPTGGVLVRPDQHVAWRGVTSEATEGLAAAMAAVSGDS